MTIGSICRRAVVTASSAESVAVVAERMIEHNVGSAVVVDGARPVAMITDRDIALRCAGARLDPVRTPVSSVMTRMLHALDESTPIEEALREMARTGNRRLVVTGPERTLVGIVSIDDIVQLLVEQVGSISELLRKEGVLPPSPARTRTK